MLAKKKLVALAEKKLTRRLRVKHQSCVSYVKDSKMDYNDYDIEVRKARVKARLDAAIEESALSGEDGIRRERRVWPYVAGITVV